MPVRFVKYLARLLDFVDDHLRYLSGPRKSLAEAFGVLQIEAVFLGFEQIDPKRAGAGLTQ